MCTVDDLITALKADNWLAVQTAIANVEAAGAWRSAIIAIIRTGKPHATISAGFHTLWTERGHRIREQVSADGLLADALHILLPAYVGPGMVLFRGENADRWRDRALGFAWTAQEEPARMFAKGLYALYDAGGVLLSTDAPAPAIIAGPGRHSIYLQENEYVVDKRKLREIVLLGSFPRVN